MLVCRYRLVAREAPCRPQMPIKATRAAAWYRCSFRRRSEGGHPSREHGRVDVTRQIQPSRAMYEASMAVNSSANMATPCRRTRGSHVHGEILSISYVYDVAMSYCI